ncbi:MAG: hypothetical protein KGQ57_12135 [Burkholderiales bacterium]|nr:hypothetical protein [Burkholderiales bacterium]
MKMQRIIEEAQNRGKAAMAIRIEHDARAEYGPRATTRLLDRRCDDANGPLALNEYESARIERANKKRCWIPSNSAFVRALSASIVSSFSTCKFGASELRRRLNNPVFCDNLALSLVVHSSTQFAHSCLGEYRS